jgi:hypothetical protein
VTWPADPVIALAYIAQLQRGNTLSESLVADLNDALDHSASLLQNGGSDRKLAGQLKSLADAVAERDGDAITTRQRAGLVETLSGIADGLR